MGTVFRIFTHDIREIVRSFFVLLIVLAIIVLPALYAWVNIYANNNPYVNTGNLPVAVASRDAGIRQADGTHVNAADEVKADLKKNDKIGWQFPETAEDAIEGVRAGKYYGAIIFEDNFTYNMYHLKEAIVSDDDPITFYYNEKKNAVAAKITETAANNLLETINTKYLKAVFNQVFQDTNQLSDDLDGNEAVDEALRQLKETRGALQDFNASISLFTASSDDIRSDLKEAEKHLDTARRDGKSNIAAAEASIKEAKKTAKVLAKRLKKETSRLQTEIKELKDLIDRLQKAVDVEEIQKLAKQAEEKAEKILTILKEIRGLLPERSQSDAVRIITDTLDIMILQTEGIIQLLEDDPAGNAKTLADAIASLGGLLDGDLVPGIDQFLADIEQAIRITRPLLSATGGILDQVDPVLESAGGTVGSLDTTLLRIQTVLTSLEDRLGDIIHQVESADEEDRMALLTDLLGGDPDTYSDFFSSMIQVKSHEIYSIHSYGAAMSPFYTILALWVGGVMLAALLQTSVNRRKFPKITENQAFFGRFLIFFLLGQLQAATVVAGDIFLLHVQPAHPWLMWIAASFASLVFVMFIYALALSFGDIDKGIVVVIMVLQIAGSSGTYPIEILPEIYDKIFRFFPFPYAINAMREALCGVYGNDFIIYLGKLAIFGVIGVIIGLLVRRPFVGLNQFVNEKLEETEVL